MPSFLEKKPKKEKAPEPKKSINRRFFVMSTFGELHDVAIQLQEEGEEVLLYVPDNDYKCIGDGIVPKAENWHEYLNQEYIFVIDGCENASLQDWLRKHGESVVGTNVEMSKYENDRQLGQKLFKEAGFEQSESHNFKDLEEAISFVKENNTKRWILKQNGDLPKHLNHMGKFKDGSDMLFHLEELKKSWKINEWGPVDFDLMEIVVGMEMAASAFFNGHDWLRNSEGKVVGFLNQEYKKQSDGDLGETTGEMGTVFIGVTEDDDDFSDMLLRPEVVAKLKETKYHGVFDINGCITEERGFVAFEPTSRFGVPASSYEFIEGLDMSTADLLEYMAKGIDKPISIHEDIGIVSVVVAKPFPIEADVDDESTSLGQKLWILNGKKPAKDFTKEQKKHIHLENFKRDEDGNYRVASKSGYLLTVTGRGDSVERARDEVLEYIKNNIYISGMIFRQDLGRNIGDFI